MRFTKNLYTLAVLIALFTTLNCTKSPVSAQVEPGFAELTGPYLGQAPPGRNLIPFAQNIIGNWNHAEVTVSPDGQEIYWTDGTSIYYTEIQSGRWTIPEIVSFSGLSSEFRYDDVPVVSPDNSKLFFLSKRPISYNSPNDENIWYVDRTETGWGEPKPLPQIVNSVTGIHWQISVSNNGTLYFSGGDKIYYSTYVDGVYIAPEPLHAINAFGDLLCPFIAPDESYIIFIKVVNSVGFLYISFKDINDQWKKPVILDVINEPTSFVSRDGKYFFTGHHWISAEIIDELRPKNLK